MRPSRAGVWSLRLGAHHYQISLASFDETSPSSCRTVDSGTSRYSVYGLRYWLASLLRPRLSALQAPVHVKPCLDRHGIELQPLTPKHLSPGDLL